MPIGSEKRLARRRHILASARNLLARVGYDKVTIRALAEASGVTVPTLYNTFGAKDALLFEAVMEAFEELLATSGPEAGVRGLDRIVAIVSSSAETVVREPDYARTLLESFRNRPRVGRLARAVYESQVEAFAAAVEEIRDDGELEDWARTGPLAVRIAGHQIGAHQFWHAGVIPADQLRTVVTYGTCLMLGGATRGATAERCRAIARGCQELLTER